MMFAYNEETILPSISRSSSERSSSSTGSQVCSNKFVAPNLSRTDVGSSLLWDHREETLGSGQDQPLWDTDIGDPACTWDLDLSQRLAEKLFLADEEEEKMPPQVYQMSQSQPADYLNMQLLAEEDSNLNATIDNSGVPNPRFKTEICRNFKERGTCLYGDLCQFAHGKHELRKDVVRHNKYKTKHCQKYWIAGYCAYGPRCNFIHQEREQTKSSGVVQTNTTSMRRSVNPVTFKTAAQVVNFANLRKASLADPSDSSGSDDGKHSSSRSGDIKYLGARDGGLFGLDKFPTFVPRSTGYVGPVGSGRPRVVWPGA